MCFKLQIKDLKLEDPWAKRCAPAGYIVAKDEMGRRCGLAPPPYLQEVLKKAAETAKEIISKKHVSNIVTIIYSVNLFCQINSKRRGYRK